MSRKMIGFIWVSAIILFTSLVATGMWGCPQYRVYRMALKGKAELVEAVWSRQIRVEEAEAKLEAANFDKLTDSTRAIGISIANHIISESITPEYIRWLWVEGLHDGTSEVIYIPTEAGIPILEAGKRYSVAPPSSEKMHHTHE